MPRADGRRHGGHLHGPAPVARGDRARPRCRRASTCVGLSILSGAHLPLCRKVASELRAAGAARRRARGSSAATSRARDHAALARARRATRVFPTGTPLRRRSWLHPREQVRRDERRREQRRRPAESSGSRGSRSSRSTAPSDVSATGGSDGIGAPGEFPYTRGIHPLMYRKRPWTMRQYSGFGTAAETRERFLYLIEHGQTGLNVAFDLPTQCGLDSDDPMAEGEVGRVGMAVDTLADMEEAFDGHRPQPDHRLAHDQRLGGRRSWRMYFAMAEKRGFALARAARHRAERHPQGVHRPRHLDLPGRAVASGSSATPSSSARASVPHYSPVSVCGYHIRESRRDAGPGDGLRPRDRAAPTSTTCSRAGSTSTSSRRASRFNFDIHGNLWEQVAKFRAGRRLWAKIDEGALRRQEPARDAAAHDRGRRRRRPHGASSPRTTSCAAPTTRWPARSRGTQTMALCSYDEAYTIPSEHAAQLSLRTMQILMHEAGAVRHRRSARRLVLRRVHDQRDGGAHRRASCEQIDARGRHREVRRRGARAGRREPPGLRARAASSSAARSRRSA